MRTVTYALEIDWSGTSTWVDESDYLLAANGNEEIAPPQESAFASGGYVSEASFTLFNLGQRFSPTNSSGDLYADIRDGKYYQRKVRFTVTLGGVASVVFRGFIKGITEDARTPTSSGAVVLRCSSEDAGIISKKLSTTSATTRGFYDTGKDESELIVATLTLAGLSDGTHFVSQAYGGTTTLDRGLFTIPWYWLDGESPLEDCWKVASACGGRFYYNTADGKYYYENMQQYGWGASGSSQGTLSEDNCENISPLYTDKELYSSVKVTIRPRRIGETQLLWEPDTIPTLMPGQVIVLVAKLTAPVYQFTDVTIKATSTGGFDGTSDISYNADYNTQDVIFTITNSGPFLLFLRSFKLTGRFIEGGATNVYTKASPDTSYWSTRKGRERMINENPYIQTTAQGQALCDMLAERQGYATSKFSVKGYRGTVFFRCGNLATVTNTTVGISDSAIITSSQWTLGLGSFSQNLTLFSNAHIYPRAVGNYFIIGTHSQNSSKRYFY
jgi:hypothetical protein